MTFIISIVFVKLMKPSEALYLKPLCIMHYKSSFNALIMLRNAPYNALYDLMNNCNHIVMIHYNTCQFIFTLCILNLVIIIYYKI